MIIVNELNFLCMLIDPAYDIHEILQHQLTAKHDIDILHIILTF